MAFVRQFSYFVRGHPHCMKLGLGLSVERIFYETLRMKWAEQGFCVINHTGEIYYETTMMEMAG